MKPRITWGWYNCMPLAGAIIGGWYCEGDKVKEFGATPIQAYQRWQMMRSRQHMLQLLETPFAYAPPKKTFWQKIGSWLEHA